MNRPCPDWQDQIVDSVLGGLDGPQTEDLQRHLAACEPCREYARSLQEQEDSLVALGREIETGLEARQDRVIEALQDVSPAGIGVQRIFPAIGRLLRVGIAAVLVLGAGVAIGRWTAPRPIDVEQLRADLQASIAASPQPAVRESILAEVDRRLAAGLAANEAGLRAELTDQLRGDLQVFATQFSAGSERLLEKRFTELVQMIEEARLKDRQRVATALEQIEQNRRRDKTQIGWGLQSLASLTAKAVPAMQH